MSELVIVEADGSSDLVLDEASEEGWSASYEVTVDASTWMTVTVVRLEEDASSVTEDAGLGNEGLLDTTETEELPSGGHVRSGGRQANINRHTS